MPEYIETPSHPEPMAETPIENLETILRHCAEADPKPWYPRLYAGLKGISRDSLDPPLEKLRLGGLIQLTPWEQETGQGYALTSEGRQLLESPRDLDRLKKGILPIRPQVAPPRADANGEALPTFERREIIRQTFLYPPAPLIGRFLLFANLAIFAIGMVKAVQADVPLAFYGAGGGSMGRLLGQAPGPALHQFRYNRVLSAIGMVKFDDLAQGQWWRLVSYSFVHIGLLHLAMNMLFLVRSGAIIESMWGHARFLWIYLLSGLGGGCAGIMANPIGLAGASGALCGMFAAEIAWFFLNRRDLPAELRAAWSRILIINVVLVVLISLLPGVSGMGHLGGAVVGFVTALLLHVNRFHAKSWVRVLAVVSTLILPIVSVMIVAFAVQRLTLSSADLDAASAADREAKKTLEHNVAHILKTPIDKALPYDPDETDIKLAELGHTLEALDRHHQALKDFVEHTNRSLFPAGLFNDSGGPESEVAKIRRRWYVVGLIGLYLSKEFEARRVFEQQAKISIMRDPSRRAPEDIKRLKDELGKVQADVVAAADSYAHLGNSGDPDLEELQKALEKILRQWANLMNATAEYLGKAANNEAELDFQIRQINKGRVALTPRIIR